MIDPSPSSQKRSTQKTYVAGAFVKVGDALTDPVGELSPSLRITE